MKRLPPYHPVLFAVSAVLAFYVRNAAGLSPHELVPPLALSAVMAVGVYLMAALAMQNTAKGSIAAAFFVILFFNYDAFCRGISGLTSSPFDPMSEVGLFIPAAMLVALLCVLAVTERDLLPWTRWLNATSLILTLMPLLLLSGVLSLLSGHGAPNASARSDQRSFRIQAGKSAPDIYYIVLDGHGSTDVLRDVYGYDNSSFVNHLREKGFFIADKARSNYSQTLCSLASSLNMDYLEQSPDLASMDCASPDQLLSTVGNNLVAASLKKAGYRVVQFSTGDARTNLLDCDMRITTDRSSEFTVGLMQLTPLPNLMSSCAPKYFQPYEQHRRGITYTLEHLQYARRRFQPTLVFAHIMCPHPPFVFGPNGEPRDPGRGFNLGDGSEFVRVGGTKQEYVDGYRDQIAFLDQQLQKTIDEILSKASRPTIIIVQGDHGPGSMLDQRDIRNSDPRERLSILNAYYFPDKDYRRLRRDITPVNSFRVVMNQFLGGRLDILKDESFMSPLQHPYDVSRVDKDWNFVDQQTDVASSSEPARNL